MLSTALEQERLLLAGRLLSEIERRHGLPHPIQRELHPVIMDRFIAVYLPEPREGEPVPQTLEYAFAATLTAAAKKAAAAPKAAVKAAPKKTAAPKAPASTPAKTFAGHPVKGA